MTLYRALVNPVLLYNSETWALGKADKDGLDSFHRQQLRRVLNVKCPNDVANVELYRQTAETKLQLEVLERRWRYFGHVLRHDRETSCWRTMTWYFDQTNHKRCRGRPRQTILTTLNADITNLINRNPVFCNNTAIRHISCLDDLYFFREVATNRPRWRNLTNVLQTAAKVTLSLIARI